MKIWKIIITGTLLAAGVAQAAVINLAVDAGNSSTPAYGSTLVGVINDPFVYDPASPYDPAPHQGFAGGDLSVGYHGDGGTSHILSYTNSGGAFTTSGSDTNIVVDLWGRSETDGVTDPSQHRDDNITVTLYNGDYSAVVGTAVSLGIPDTPEALARAVFNVGAGVTFDRIQITSTDQYFTLLEARVAAVQDAALPEPPELPYLIFAADVGNSSTPAFGSTLEGVFNDPFAYDPSNPYDPAPVQILAGDNSIAYHGDIGTSHTLSYTNSEGAFTTAGVQTNIIVDLWGRSDTIQNRDDNITVTLYNGDYSTVVGTPVSLGIPGAPDVALARAVFNVGAGVAFDRIQITSTDSYFTLLEARVAAVQETDLPAPPSLTYVLLDVDALNSATPAFGSTLEGTINDPFEYDPLDSPATAPAQIIGDITGAYHGDATTSHTLSYTTTHGAYTTSATNPVMVVDLWGRTDGFQERDNNITVTLYNGDYSTVVGSPVSLGIPDTPEAYARAMFELGAGVTFDRMKITSTDAYFTLMETRLAAIPDLATPFPTIADPDLLVNGGFTQITNEVPVGGGWYTVNGSLSDWSGFWGLSANLIGWSHYHADPNDLGLLIGNTNSGPDAGFVLDGTDKLNTDFNSNDGILNLNSSGEYRNGMMQTLGAVSIDPALTYELTVDVKKNAAHDHSSATFTLALTSGSGADATNLVNAVTGGLLQIPTASLSDSYDTQTLQISGAELTGTLNVLIENLNTEAANTTPEDPANVSQVTIAGVSLSYPTAEGDLNKDGYINANDVALANSYLDGSIDGGDDAVTRQNQEIANGNTPAEALALLNLTDFDIDGDGTFDAADVTALEALVPPLMIVSGAMDGSGNLDVDVSGMIPGTTYHLKRSTDLVSGSFDTTVDSVTPASESATMTDTNPPADTAFYMISD